MPENFVYRDRSDDGGPKPLREALRFASIAPHNLPCRERFAGRFSEGVLAHVLAQDVVSISLNCFSGIRRAQRGTWDTRTGNPRCTRGTVQIYQSGEESVNRGFVECNKPGKFNFFAAD